MRSPTNIPFAPRHYIVTRHPGARGWIQARLNMPACIVIEHVESLALRPGDQVYGVFPIALAAEMQAQGAHCWHLTFKPQASQRGTELTAAQLDGLHATLVCYSIQAVAEMACATTNHQTSSQNP